MAAATKHFQFVEDLGLGVHNLNTGTVKVMLTLTAPTTANAVKADLTEIAAGSGYTAGGEDTQNTFAESSGTATMTGTKVTWTSGGAFASFRYVDAYNDTPTSPADPLIMFWDYGSTLVLGSGETFDWRPNNSITTGTMLTIV